MINRIVPALKRRRKWAQVGVYFLRTKPVQTRQLTIAGKVIPLLFPPGEKERHHYELGEIYLADCYKLRGLKEIHTIVDIGANVGLFSMIARHHFPQARIDAYEPNPGLLEIIESHLRPLGINLYHEAVGLENGRSSPVNTRGSLDYQVMVDPSGDLPMAGVSTVLERIGGTIDLLKMDCEGGEWEILQSNEFMRNVRTLAMEYHPRKQNVPVLNELILLLRRHKFHQVEIHQRVDESWGLLHATRA